MFGGTGTLKSPVRMFVLAGGKGERFFPFSSLIPKCLIPVAAGIGWYNATRSLDLRAIGDGIVKDMSAPFALAIDTRFDFYYTPGAYESILLGRGYIFVDSLFAIYDQTPEWKVVVKRIDLENVTEVASNAKDLGKIYDNGLMRILFKEG